jgi:DNA-binding response OmpR family regulator
LPQPNRVGDHPTLLLIDDCVAQRDMYEVALAPDFNILTATRGDDGIELAAARRPDAIVLDVMMPGLDGWQTCTRLKSDEVTADIPVILLTGANDLDLSVHAVAVGASNILKKPCPADTLKNVVRSALSQSASHPASHDALIGMSSRVIWIR